MNNARSASEGSSAGRLFVVRASLRWASSKVGSFGLINTELVHAPNIRTTIKNAAMLGRVAPSEESVTTAGVPLFQHVISCEFCESLKYE